MKDLVTQKENNTKALEFTDSYGPGFQENRNKNSRMYVRRD